MKVGADQLDKIKGGGGESFPPSGGTITAGDMAKHWNAVSAAAATVAAIAVAIPGGQGAALVFAFVSAVAAGLNAKNEVLGNDPPRDEANMVSLAIFVQGCDCVPESVLRDPIGILRAFALEGLNLGSCLDDAILSLERYQGAVRLGEREGAPYRALQLEALRHNSQMCALRHDRLVMLAPRVNIAWYLQLEEFRVSGSAPTAEQVRDAYEELYPLALSEFLDSTKPFAVDLDAFSPRDGHPVRRDGFEPSMPDRIVGDEMYRALIGFGDELRGLVVPE